MTIKGSLNHTLRTNEGFKLHYSSLHGMDS